MTRPYSSRAGLALLVAALHVLLLAGAWRLQAWKDRGPPALPRAPLIVWLQGAPQPAVAPLPSELPSTLPRPPRPPPLALPVPGAAPANPQAITWPTPAPARAAVEANAAASSPASSVPLNLALPGRPRGASAPWHGERSPALDDPRSNGVRPTLESRIAAALGGSDQITEYRLEDGSVRLKRGTACVVVRPNRASTLDPFNASAQSRPRLLDRC